MSYYYYLYVTLTIKLTPESIFILLGVQFWLNMRMLSSFKKYKISEYFLCNKHSGADKK